MLEDGFRRDQDPRRRRNARVAGALVATCLVGLGAAVSLTRGASSSPPAATAAPRPAQVPTPLPSPRPTPVPAGPVLGSGFSAVYDPPAHRLLTFGGVDSYDATWLWDGRRWTLARPSVSPPGRFNAAAAYDPAMGVVLLYGGRLGPGQVVDDTWAWDGATWRELDPGTGSPPLGEGSVMGWDDRLGEMVLVSSEPGAGGGTWTWNGARWVRRPSGDMPSGTFVVGMAVDPLTHVLVGVSCCSVGEGVTSTWAWNGAGWRRLATHAVPAFIVALVRDPVAARLLLFGAPAVASGREMWSWSGRDWTLLTGARLPVFPAGTVVDPDTGRIVVLGSLAEPVQGHPQPIHLWSWTGAAWHQLG